MNLAAAVSVRVHVCVWICVVEIKWNKEGNGHSKLYATAHFYICQCTHAHVHMHKQNRETHTLSQTDNRLGGLWVVPPPNSLNSQPCSAPSGSPPGLSGMPALEGGGGLLGCRLNFPFQLMLTKGFPQNKQRIKAGKVHQMWKCRTTVLLLEIFTEENLYHWCSISSSISLPTIALYILCFPLQSSHTLPAEAWRGWKKKLISLSATGGLHCQSRLLLQI